MDLPEFLLARIAEDEETARAAGGRSLYSYEEGGGDGWAVEGTDGSEGAIIGDRALAEHIARHDPARVLADCAAKRAIVDEHEMIGSDLYPEEGSLWCATCTPRKTGPCQTLRLLALPYADCEGYDPAWKPEEAG